MGRFSTRLSILSKLEVKLFTFCFNHLGKTNSKGFTIKNLLVVNTLISIDLENGDDDDKDFVIQTDFTGDTSSYACDTYSFKTPPNEDINCI